MKRLCAAAVMLVCLLMLTSCGSSTQEPIPYFSRPTAAASDSVSEPSSMPDPVQEMLQSMTTEEKVGQMFFVRCNPETAITDIGKFHLGGYILFAENTEAETRGSLRETIARYQAASKIGLLIGVDEEGGTVNRLSRFPQFRAAPFRSPQSLFQEGGYSLIQSDTKQKADLLLSVGINVNLAPVCDVSTDPQDYMYQRSFGKDAQETAEYVKTVVEEMRSNRMGSTLKHFPGYGSNQDTHTGMAIDERSYETFQTVDFLPFEAGIKAGADSVLVSHNIVTCMDETMPSSLSPKVHEILRKELGFTGVIMTDDLRMDAIRRYVGDSVSAVYAINAGNDLIVASDYEEQIPSVLAAVEAGEITQERLDASVRRILRWKQRLGIMNKENIALK